MFENNLLLRILIKYQHLVAIGMTCFWKFKEEPRNLKITSRKKGKYGFIVLWEELTNYLKIQLSREPKRLSKEKYKRWITQMKRKNTSMSIIASSSQLPRKLPSTIHFKKDSNLFPLVLLRTPILSNFLNSFSEDLRNCIFCTLFLSFIEDIGS